MMLQLAVVIFFREKRKEIHCVIPKVMEIKTDTITCSMGLPSIQEISQIVVRLQYS